MTLNARQRQALKKLAHALSPIVRVGRVGITPEVIKETDRSLLAHELIKVRVEADASKARKDIAGQLAESAGAELVNVIGKIAILFRPRPEKPRIQLPE